MPTIYRRSVASLFGCILVIVAPAFAQAEDADLDAIEDALDNCPSVYNPAQADADTDGEGDQSFLIPATRRCGSRRLLRVLNHRPDASPFTAW